MHKDSFLFPFFLDPFHSVLSFALFSFLRFFHLKFHPFCRNFVHVLLSTTASNHIFIGLHNFTYALHKMCVVFFPSAAVTHAQKEQHHRTKFSTHEIKRSLASVFPFFIVHVLSLQWCMVFACFIMFQETVRRTLRASFFISKDLTQKSQYILCLCDTEWHTLSHIFSGIVASYLPYRCMRKRESVML